MEKGGISIIINPLLRGELTKSFTNLFRMKASYSLNLSTQTANIHQLNLAINQAITETSINLDQIVNITIRYPSEAEDQHAVNVCLLSVITGLYLKFEPDTLRHLALGALFHDLGKSLLPPGDEDRAYLHTVYGCKLVYRNNLSATASRIVAEHHEAFNGSGYPQGLTRRSIHPLSRLVCITDYFDTALRECSRTHKKRQEVIKKMIGAETNKFDPHLLLAFLCSVTPSN